MLNSRLIKQRITHNTHHNCSIEQNQYCQPSFEEDLSSISQHNATQQVEPQFSYESDVNGYDYRKDLIQLNNMKPILLGSALTLKHNHDKMMWTIREEQSYELDESMKELEQTPRRKRVLYISEIMQQISPIIKMNKEGNYQPTNQQLPVNQSQDEAECLDDQINKAPLEEFIKIDGSEPLIEHKSDQKVSYEQVSFSNKNMNKQNSIAAVKTNNTETTLKSLSSIKTKKMNVDVIETTIWDDKNENVEVSQSIQVEEAIKQPKNEQTWHLMPNEHKNMKNMKQRVKIVYECTDRELQSITQMLAQKGINLIEQKQQNTHQGGLKRNEQQKKGITRIVSSKPVLHPKNTNNQKIRLTAKTLQKHQSNITNQMLRT